MFLKPPKIRQFKYNPMYYKPPEEEEEEGSRIKFRRRGISKSQKKRSILGMILLVLILIFLLSYWLSLDSSNEEDFRFEVKEIR